MTEEEQEKALIQEAKRLNLSAMKTLNYLMLNATTERIRLAAAHDWLEHQRNLEVAAIKSQAETEKPSSITINIGDEKNVRQIRERLLNAVPIKLPAGGDAE